MLHQELTFSKWQQIAFFEQMAHIGAEMGRTIQWRGKDVKKSLAAFERGLELLDLTIEDPKNSKKLKELCRLREMLADFFYFENTYSSTDEGWKNYFHPFNYAASHHKGL